MLASDSLDERSPLRVSQASLLCPLGIVLEGGLQFLFRGMAGATEGTLLSFADCGQGEKRLAPKVSILTEGAHPERGKISLRKSHSLGIDANLRGFEGMGKTLSTLVCLEDCCSVVYKVSPSSGGPLRGTPLRGAELGRSHPLN